MAIVQLKKTYVYKNHEFLCVSTAPVLTAGTTATIETSENQRENDTVENGNISV